MAIIDMPATTKKTIDNPTDASSEHVLVCAKRPMSSQFEPPGLPQQDDLGYGDYDSSEHSPGNSPDSPDEIPRQWTWGFKRLESLLSEARGAATNQVVKFVGRHLIGTKLIFVVGKAGTGKTSILSELTGLDTLQPGISLKSGTKRYRVCPSIIDDEQYLFVDTAGFGDLDRDDIETFKDSVSSLIAFGSFIEVVGVLYVMGNPGTRLDQQDAKTLRWLQCFCGPDFFRNVTIITSFWDSHSASSFKQAYSRMQSLYEDQIFDQVLHPVTNERRYHGAHIYHHGVTGGNLTLESYPGLDYDEHRQERCEELRNLIRRRYAERRYKPTKLQFMREVEEDVPILETEAAKVLRAPPVGITINILKGRCMVDAAPTAQEAPSLVYGQLPKVPETSWKETMLEWWSVVEEAARIFDDARKKRAPVYTAGLTGIFQGICNWWNSSTSAGQL